MKKSPIKNMAYWKTKNATTVKADTWRNNPDLFHHENKEKINSLLFGSSKLPPDNVRDPKEELRRKHGGNEPRKDDEGNIISIIPN